MVIGFDMVNEEDFTPDIDHFLPQIYEAREKAAKLGREFPLYLHCGETNDVNHTQLYDAILLETKRIGHGFHLAYHPELLKIVKEKDICIECCPVSNLVLAYVTDMRCHPTRGLLHQGVPVTISSDDPGFMGYEGVTLDYLYVFLSWELDIADLKQLVLNSIKYSSVSEN
jgi:adenosine deaminase CECR1